MTFSDEYFIPPSVVKCAEWDQLPKVARTKFRSHNDLLLLTIDIEQVEHYLIRESPEGHREPFPHVYAPIPWTAVMFHRPYLRHLDESMWIERTRCNRTWMERLLHNDYEEFGASGSPTCALGRHRRTSHRVRGRDPAAPGTRSSRSPRHPP